MTGDSSDGLQKKVKDTDGKVKHLSARVENVERKMEGLEKKMELMDQNIEDMKTRIEAKFQEIDARMQVGFDTLMNKMNELFMKESESGATKAQKAEAKPVEADVKKTILEHELSGDQKPARESEIDNVICKEAAEAQSTVPFDADNLYRTLINPFDRTRAQLSQFGVDASVVYSSRKISNVVELFDSDFTFWMEEHLALVPTDSLTNIRDLLKEEGLDIDKGPGIKIARVLAVYLQTIRKERRKSLMPTVPSYHGESSGGRCESYMNNATARHAAPVGHGQRLLSNQPKPEERMSILSNRNLHDRTEGITREPYVSDRRASFRDDRMGSFQANMYPADDSVEKRFEQRGRPSDVSKLFPRDQKYSGGPMEPLHRRFGSFKDACSLSNIDMHDTNMVFPLLKTTFLKGPALIYFTDVAEGRARSVEEAVEMLEKQFLNVRTRRVNDSEWHELTFEYVKSKRSFEEKSVTHADVLTDLLGQISELSDMRTGPGSDTAIMSKTIEAVRGESVFDGIVSNPPTDLQDLNAALRSRALETDRSMIRSSAKSLDRAFVTEEHDDQDEDESYYIDRFIRTNDHLGPRRSSRIRGYGFPRGSHSGARRGQYRGRGRRPFQRRGGFSSRPHRYLPPDVCSICFQKGCHSSKHFEASEYGKRAARQYLADLDVSGDQEDITEHSGAHNAEDVDLDEDEMNGASWLISQTRAVVAMGMSHKDTDFVIDAILLDTGSSNLSTVGDKFVQAVIVASVKRTCFNKSVSRNIVGIGGGTKTLGIIVFSFFFGGQICTVDVHVLPGTSPFILSHQDMDRIGINYQSLFKIVERPDDGYSEPVEMRGNLPFLVFSSFGFFSDVQLRAMHRNLGHPSLEKQMKVIEDAGLEDLPDGTRKQLKDIIDRCRPCQLMKAKPRRFLFSIKDGCTGEFNHVLQIDVAKLPGGNVLHIICRGTGFQQGLFLSAMTADEAWKTLRRCWINVYAGAPDYIEADAGTNFTSSEFETAANGLGIALKIAPVEAHDRVGQVERSHAVLRTVFKKITLDMPKLSKHDRLSLSFRAINDAPNSNTGISPTALVFGVFPKIPGARNRGSMAERANVIRECTQIVMQLNARHKVRDSMKNRNSPSIIEIERIRALEPGQKVLVHQEKVGWTPFTLVRVAETTVDVILPSGKITTFGINKVRPFLSPDDKVQNAVLESQPPQTTRTTGQGQTKPWFLTQDMECELQQESADVHFTDHGIPKEQFFESRQEEINALHELKCFDIVDESESHGHRLYRARFVDKLKADGSKRSRLCVAACNDRNHGLFTGAPTVKRMSLRLLASLSTSYGYELYTRDVTKAFVMSKTLLRRPVFMKPPSEMKLQKGKVVKVIKPLYGMPESPMHWYNTYLGYHRESLGMTQLDLDPCLLVSHTKGETSGMLSLQVDDTLFSGSKEFLSIEEKASSAFPNKGRTRVDTDLVMYNGIGFVRNRNVLQMNQATYIENIPSPFKKRDLGESKAEISFEIFRSTRAMFAYAAYSTTPDVIVFVTYLAQFTEERYLRNPTEAIRILRKLRKIATRAPSLSGLRFVDINHKSMDVVACIDASFATNMDRSSQLGVLILLRERDTGRANVVHFASLKSKRVCKSVLAAELFAMVDGFDLAFSIRDAVVKVTGDDDINLTIYTDSQTLFGLCVSLASPTEKRLQIDLAAIRQAYERRELSSIVWIPGHCNPADDLTKVDKRSGTLADVLSTNTFKPPPGSWIERDAGKDGKVHWTEHRA